MVHDPIDETFRKARRLRNTPLQKYIRTTSVIITLMYAGAMYISYRRNILPYLDDERYKISEDDREMQYDYVTSPFWRGIIDKIVEKREANRLKICTKSKNQIEENTQTNKD